LWLRRTMRVSAVRQRAIEKAPPATHELSGCRKEGRGMDDRSLLLEDVEVPYPPEHPVDLPRIERAIREILHAIGEDPDREGLKDTPARVARAYEFLFAGLHVDPTQQLTVGFQEDHHEMVLLRNIPFYSTCEHHLLPMIGKAHVGYIPDGKVVGLSKLARVVEGYSRRPQLQERLTAQVADALHQSLGARGAIVVVEADHLCMTVRGVQKPGSMTVTSAVRGLYAKDQRTRQEAMSLINGQR
jgi:GTP cyclohydrolase IA